MPQQYSYIDRQDEWDAAAGGLRQSAEVALDTERNGRFAYQECICLIQICDGRRTMLADPLRIGTLTDFGELLADPAVGKVIHGSDEDVRFFHSDFGCAVDGLFDTGVAARFLGVRRPNLAAVLEEFAGVVIPKDPRLQASNWAQRPLPQAALDYAASDVHYLLPLADELRYRLEKAGRLDWVMEECQRIQELRHPPQEPLETAFRRIKGWETLNGREAAILQELYAFRDGKACFWNLPPTIAASNADLLELARSGGATPRGVGGMLTGRCYGELLEAIERGMENPEIPRPLRAEPANSGWTAERRERLGILKGWRNALAQQLGLAVNHIWPTASLERMALGQSDVEQELANDNREVRRWQRGEFGEGLRQLARQNGW